MGWHFTNRYAGLLRLPYTWVFPHSLHPLRYSFSLLSPLSLAGTLFLAKPT